MVANLRQGVHVGIAKVPHEGVPSDNRKVELLTQLVHQRLRHQLEDGNLAAVHPLPVLEMVVLEELPDALAELGGYPALLEVLPQDGLLPSWLRLQLPDVHHAAGDAADEGGEGHQRKEEDADGVDPLREVVRVDLHACWCELCQRPVKRGRVEVLITLSLQDVRLEPPIIVYNAYQVPAASDVVVEDDKHKEHEEYRAYRPHKVRLDVREQGRQQPGKLQAANKPHGTDHSEEPEDARGLAHANDGLDLESEDRQHPVHQYNEQIQCKTTAKIPLRNPARAHLHQALAVEPSEEGRQDVYRPEGGGGPFNAAHRELLVVLVVEDLQWNCDNVEA
mmetsp:Transcript_21490/g.68080  ORF Transcript_21490/g.68080 Transcript_21490/m.68080 type:complete len:335 (+) Transcript_21490:652-1656(+)